MNENEAVSISSSPQQQVVTVASAILSGQLGVIEGSRLLCSLRSRVSSLDHDPDFIAFVGLDSETDHLPIGAVRRHWAPAALANKDIQIQAAEQHWHDTAIAACHRLLRRFSTAHYDQDGKI